MLLALVIFLCLVIAVLAVPVSFVWDVVWKQSFEGYIQLVWLFGLVRIQLLTDPESSPHRKRVRRAKKKTVRKREGQLRRQSVMQIIWHQGARQRVYNCAVQCWQAVQKRDVDMNIRVGLGDPADTGILWAVLGPVQCILANFKTMSINLEPDFFNAIIELDSRGNIRLVPLKLIQLLLGLMLSPVIWRVVVQSLKKPDISRQSTP